MDIKRISYVMTYARKIDLAAIVLFYPSLVVLAVIANKYNHPAPVFAAIVICAYLHRRAMAMSATFMFDPYRSMGAEKWLRENPETLKKYEGQYVAIHPRHGVVASGRQFEEMEAKAIASGMAYELQIFDMRKLPHTHQVVMPTMPNWIEVIDWLENHQEEMRPKAGSWVAVKKGGGIIRTAVNVDAITRMLSTSNETMETLLIYMPTWIGKPEAIGTRVRAWLAKQSDLPKDKFLAINPDKGIIAQGDTVKDLGALTDEHLLTYYADKPQVERQPNDEVTINQVMKDWLDGNADIVKPHRGKMLLIDPSDKTLLAVGEDDKEIRSKTTGMDPDVVARSIIIYVPKWLA